MYEKAILIHSHNIWFYGETLKSIMFYRFDSDPRFSLLLLYIRSKFCTEMIHIFGLVSNLMTGNEKTDNA